jgi:hypothetical protein
MKMPGLSAEHRAPEPALRGLLTAKFSLTCFFATGHATPTG